MRWAVAACVAVGLAAGVAADLAFRMWPVTALAVAAGTLGAARLVDLVRARR